MKVTKQTFATFTRKKVPLANTIHHSSFIYKQFKKLNLCKSYSNRVINHLMSILISIFITGYHGKTTDFVCLPSDRAAHLQELLNLHKSVSSSFLPSLPPDAALSSITLSAAKDFPALFNK